MDFTSDFFGYFGSIMIEVISLRFYYAIDSYMV